MTGTIEEVGKSKTSADVNQINSVNIHTDFSNKDLIYKFVVINFV